jgi:hypothetical protein
MINGHSWGMGTKYFIDYDTSSNGWVPRRGPFDSLTEAFAEWEKLPHTLRYRLRGPDNTVHAESHEGNVFRHDPPRTYKINQ